nr:hypothetical protein [Bacillus cereus]
MRLNHLNLCVDDLSEARHFIEVSCLDYRNGKKVSKLNNNHQE